MAAFQQLPVQSRNLFFPVEVKGTMQHKGLYMSYFFAPPVEQYLDAKTAAGYRTMHVVSMHFAYVWQQEHLFNNFWWLHARKCSIIPHISKGCYERVPFGTLFAFISAYGSTLTNNETYT